MALLAVEVPPGPTTWTFTDPAPTGAMALMVVGDVTVKSDEAFSPKSTAVALANPDPEMSIVSPPPAVPLDGASAVSKPGQSHCPSYCRLPGTFALDCAGVADVAVDERTVTGPMRGDP